MQIELANPDRVPMCFIGPHRLTFETPEADVDVAKLSDVEKSQVLFNLRRGVLKTTDKDEIKLLFPRPVEEQIVQPKEPSVLPEEEDRKKLVKMLSKSVASVKKEASELRLAQVRRMLDIEEQGKNRKSLVKFLSELVSKHQQEVHDKLGSESLEVQLPDIGVDVEVVTDVEDSEEEEHTVAIPEK